MESTKKTGLRFVVLPTLSTVSSSCLAMSLRTKGPPDGAWVQKLVFEFEPVNVVVGGSHDAGQPSPLQTAFEFDGWMHGFETEVVDHTIASTAGTLRGSGSRRRWHTGTWRRPTCTKRTVQRPSQASAQAVNCSVASTR